MNNELHKRLEEAAEEYARHHYQDGDIMNISDFAFVITYDTLNKDIKRAVKAGAEFGYKEAIVQAKAWLKEHLGICVNTFTLADFEADMNKLWEEQK